MPTRRGHHGHDQLALDCLVYAEGDSWFDKFTPIPSEGTNLLEEIRTPYVAGVVDVAHIGDEARDMVRGWQASRTREMFRLFPFKAILLSAGGNDLKNLFSDLFDNKGLQRAGLTSRLSASELEGLTTPASYTAFFQDVITNIQRFVDIRDEAQDPVTRKAPIFLHGYDYLQPVRQARRLAGTKIGLGPCLYPSLLAAGLTDVEMRSVADAIVDELNRQLQLGLRRCAECPRHRPTRPADACRSPDEAGFQRLARRDPSDRAWVRQAGHEPLGSRDCESAGMVTGGGRSPGSSAHQQPEHRAGRGIVRQRLTSASPPARRRVERPSR